MPKFNYVAMDSRGKETKGTLEVASQNEAIGRVKEMGLFPTKIVEIEKAEKADKKTARPTGKAAGKKKGGVNLNISIPGLSGKVKAKVQLDRELIGGIKVVLGDKVIDGSARAQLGALETALKA